MTQFTFRALVGGLAVLIFLAGMFAGAAAMHHLTTSVSAAEGDRVITRLESMVMTVVDEEGRVRSDAEIRDRMIHSIHVWAGTTALYHDDVRFAESQPRALRIAERMVRGNLYEMSPDGGPTRRSRAATTCILEHGARAESTVGDCFHRALSSLR